MKAYQFQVGSWVNWLVSSGAGAVLRAATTAPRGDRPSALLVSSSRIENELLVGLAALQKQMRLGGVLHGKLTLATKVKSPGR